MPEVANNATNREQKNLLDFIVIPHSSEEISSRKTWFVRQAAKKEGEALHIVSPSTIPLTLGEEMAVLVLPKLFYQTR